MNIKEIKKEALLARICATRQIMGEDAAQAAAESINQLLKEKEEAERYLEKAKTALWLGSMTFDKAMDFSPEQLQKFKEILT